MTVNIAFTQKLDKAYEGATLAEILQAPPSALAGLTERHDEALATVGIKTIRDLGTKKYARFARVLVEAEEAAD